MDAQVQGLLRRGFDEGVERYGELGLDFDRYASDVEELVKQARAALGLPMDDQILVAALRKRALADLYLTRACEAGHELAWEALVANFEHRLAGLARKEEGRRATPEASASELMATLALPPPKGQARTHIGTFAGMGALWAWLATNLVRGLWKSERKRAREAAELPEDESQTRGVAPVWAGQVAEETAASLATTLDDVWQTLTREERLCLILKHRQSLAQRRIGELFAVPEYQVSRWIKRAMAKLRAAIDHGVRAPDSTDRPTWEHLRATLGSKLASFEALEAPSLGGSGETP